MRLSVAFWHGVEPGDPEPAVKRTLKLGIGGLVLVAPGGGWPAEDIERGRQAFAANGLFISEVAIREYHLLVHDDEAVRRKGIASVLKQIVDACALDARGVTVHWFADEMRNWWTDEIWTRLVAGTAEVAAAAEELEINLGFHSFNLGPWDSPEQHRRLIDDVASPRMKVLFDPVNMMGHRHVLDTTGFLDHCFDLLGADIIGAHAKDVDIDRSHWVIKIDEIPPGTGTLDYETFLRRMDQVGGDTVLTIEHLRDVGVSGSVASPNLVYYNTDVEILQAKQYIEEVAGRIGVEFD